jgi:hypothetical protein
MLILKGQTNLPYLLSLDKPILPKLTLLSQNKQFLQIQQNIRLYLCLRE